MTIRAITFDWGDTLATNHGQPYQTLHNREILEITRSRARRSQADNAWCDARIASYISPGTTR